MNIYLFIDLLMFFLVLLGYKAKPQTQKNFLLLSCILWIIIWGLRGLNVGNDTNGYAETVN